MGARHPVVIGATIIVVTGCGSQTAPAINRNVFAELVVVVVTKWDQHEYSILINMRAYGGWFAASVSSALVRMNDAIFKVR